MTLHFKTTVFAILSIGILFSCKKEPKVIAPSSESNTQLNSKTMGASGDAAQQKQVSFSDDLHAVVINEVLPASRYVYLNVTEGNDKFWIATRKQKVTIGKTYYYKGGLLKTNFESKEHKKVFNKIYLVSNLVSANHAANNQSKLPNSNFKPSLKKAISTAKGTRKINKKGSIKIAELIKNPKKYKGKTVQISGECVKINPNIMGKNWIHLKDGSKDDYDLVVTSNTLVKEGNVVTIKALVSLDKDFGAGYKYDLILEEGQVINQF